MEKKKIPGELFLASTATIWGLAFIAQKLGMNHLDALTFSASRLLIGAAVLVPIFLVIDKFNPNQFTTKNIWKVGIMLGIVLVPAINLQQMSLEYTTAGKSAFITTLYILFVPLFGLLLGRKASKLQWFGAILGTVGLYFLSIKSDFSMGYGDFIVLLGSFFWTAHILLIDRYGKDYNSAKLSSIQFLTCGVISLIIALIWGDPLHGNYLGSMGPLLFTGIVGVGGAYTFQMIGQKTVEPSTASLILSFEAVVAVIAGMIFLRETLTSREVLGCVIMFAAILLSQRGEGNAETGLSD